MMACGRTSSRLLKSELTRALADPDWEAELEAMLQSHPPRRLVSPLFSLLLSSESALKWHAVTAFGQTVDRLAGANLEAARIVMRRFMWTLTDESGGIGWGSPEAMAEIMACHSKLADEYHAVFMSYILERKGPDNFLEYAPLREGAYWGAARLAQSRRDLISPYRDWLGHSLLGEEPPQSLGYLCLAFSFLTLDSRLLKDRLLELSARGEPLSIYFNRRFQQTTLSKLANQALSPSTVQTAQDSPRG